MQVFSCILPCFYMGINRITNILIKDEKIVKCIVLDDNNAKRKCPEEGDFQCA